MSGIHIHISGDNITPEIKSALLQLVEIAVEAQKRGILPNEVDPFNGCYDNTKFLAVEGSERITELIKAGRVFATRAMFTKSQALHFLPNIQHDEVFSNCNIRVFGGNIVVEHGEEGNFKRAKEIAEWRGFGESVDGILG